MSNSINKRMIVGSLIELYPEARDVMTSYGVEFIDDDEELPLDELSNLYGIGVEGLISDIESAISGDEWSYGEHDDYEDMDW